MNNEGNSTPENVVSPKTTRRSFLGHLGGAVAGISGIAALSGSRTTLAATTQPNGRPARVASYYPGPRKGQSRLDDLSQDAFTKAVNGAFSVDLAPAQGLNLMLVQVKERPVKILADQLGDSNAYECFSLTFRGPKNRLLSQSTYKFTNDRLGTFDLFIVPMGSDDHGTYYEAQFNRPAKIRRNNPR